MQEKLCRRSYTLPLRWTEPSPAARFYDVCMACTLIDSESLVSFLSAAYSSSRVACSRLAVGGVIKQHGILVHCTITGNFVVFYTLRRGDQASIDGLWVSLLLDVLFALFDETLHPLAFLTAGCVVQSFENLFEALAVSFSLRQVLLESLLQLQRMGSFGHLGKRFHQLRFSVYRPFNCST